MQSLGRLAAGLAHELNNPASAVERSAKTLVAELGVLEDATKKFCALNLSDAQCLILSGFTVDGEAGRPPLSPLDRANRLDGLDTWLSSHDVTGVDAEPLLESGLNLEALDRLVSQVGRDKAGIVLAHMASAQAVRQLATEIETAASRIHSLVAAVKGFTYVNRRSTLQPVAIGRGLSDTVTVLRSKARAKSVAVDVVVPADLPAVDGYGGELNQVWANLLDEHRRTLQRNTGARPLQQRPREGATSGRGTQHPRNHGLRVARCSRLSRHQARRPARTRAESRSASTRSTSSTA